MARRWPQPEFDRAIAGAVVDGMPTLRILTAIREDTLDGLSRPLDLPERTFYDALRRTRERLRAFYAPPKSEQGGFWERLEELARQEEDAEDEDAPAPTLEPAAVSEPEPVKTREQLIARLGALAAEYEDSEQRELDRIIEQIRREDEARPRMVPMRVALDRMATVDPPGKQRRELPRDPGGYLPDRRDELGRFPRY